MKKSGKNVILFTAALLAGAVLLGGCPGGPSGKRGGDIAEEQKLVVFTSHKEEVYDPIVREFEARTGIWVDIKAGGTTELLEEIGESRRAGDFSCDVMFGGGIESYEAVKENFEPYRVRKKEFLNPQYRSGDDAWTAFTELPIVFVCNNKLVSREEAPGSWKELLTDPWKGRISFANPANSGSSCTALETMLQILKGDEEEILENFAKILDGKQAESSGAAIEMVASGKLPVGITLEETAMKWIDRGADLAVIYPEEGTSALPDGCAIVKGARHPDNAALFLEFIVSDDVQRFAEEYLSRRTIRRDLETERRVVGESFLDFDLELAVKRQKRILKRWAVLTDEELD